MGSTALFTFLFEHPTHAQSVELLGSWDNFTKPYQLQRDRRRGRGAWSGCYTFDNIICDGDLNDVGHRRNGALKMGGTYWYYYNVDGEESHNPSEPSTTTCPLLPGQRLNVLEVPHEARSRQNSLTSSAFTRNPSDKYLTPVPPTALPTMPSSRLGDYCKEAYVPPSYSLAPPRSATHPYTSPAYSPGPHRHARSASTSPSMPSLPLFADFKCLKQRFAHKRSASQAKPNIRGLEIGTPTLISTTAEEVCTVPLASLQSNLYGSPLPTPHTSRSLPTPSKTVFPPPFVQAKLQEFSPLGSHPVESSADVNGQTFLSAAPSDEENHNGRPRSRSDVVPSSKGSLCAPPTLVRAKTSDTRRIKLFCNEPWISSPRLPRQLEVHLEAAVGTLESAPVLQRPASSLEPPTTDARPTSRHGNDRSSDIRNSILGKDKELPPLPSFLVPAPLYAGDSAKSTSTRSESGSSGSREIKIEDTTFQMLSDHSDQPSLWSTQSVDLNSPASDGGDVHSPTFSSMTSDCSEVSSAHRFSCFSISDYVESPTCASATEEEDFAEDAQDDDVSLHRIPSLPPTLGDILPSFGSSLFDLEIQHSESAPRRRAACYGLGRLSYQLPEDETGSKTTITEQLLCSEPAIQHHGSGSKTNSYAEKLVNDFGFLGDSVV